MKKPVHVERLDDRTATVTFAIDLGNGTSAVDFETVEDEAEILRLEAEVEEALASFKPDAEAILVMAKAEAKAQVVAWAQHVLDQFTVGYPVQETLAWSAKLAAARLVLAGTSQPIIAIEAQALGVPEAYLAQKVAEKGGAYEKIVALTSAIRGGTAHAIDGATLPEQIPTILAAAMSRATATLASLGIPNAS